MKNIQKIITTLTLILAANTASAASAPQGAAQQKTKYKQEKMRLNFYVGADYIRSFVQHKYLLAEDNDLSINGIDSRAQADGAGLNLGYRLKIGDVFVAPEIFYDRIENSAKDFGYKENQDPYIARNYLNVESRYGARINLGYNIFSNVNVFVNAGLAKVKYAIILFPDGPYTENFEHNTKTAPIYGAGISFDLNRNWQMRIAYDRQQFHVRYNVASEKDTITIETAKLGIAYNF